MDDSIRFSLDGESYVLVREGSADREALDVERVSEWEAGRVLARAFGAAAPLARLGRALVDVPGVYGNAHDARSLCRRLSVQFLGREEGLVLLRRPRAIYGPISLDPSFEDAAELVSGEDLQARTWIEIALVDEDEEPCASIDCEVEFSDGSRRRGRTDSEGILRYEDIPRGTCKVWLSSDESIQWCPS